MTRPTGGSAAPFAPGSHPIAAHGGGAFAFAGMRHDGSILATPRGIRPLSAATADELDAAALAPLFDDLAEAPGSIEYLVIGMGAEIAAVSPTLRTALRDAGVRFEAMATGPALNVYNVMQAEGRRVAAALIAAP